jgi:hypothetical protein
MQIPARDSSQPVPTGTARLRGRVVAADGGGPLRRAQVRIASPEARTARTTNTDADGRFEFAELPAGRYSISVSRNGYVSLSYGQQRPFEAGRPFELANGQTVEQVDFALPRGGVITGRITDETGEPMVGVRMQAMRNQYLPGGERELLPVGGGPFGMTTNDLGEFRVYGLMPGTYVLSASTSEGFASITTVGGANVVSPAESEGHGTTYYPGTLNPDEAQPISVGLAQEASAAFSLVPTRMTTISGIVRDSQGKPLAGAPLTIRTASRGMMSFARGTGIGPDGSFRLTQVPAGEHYLEVYPRGGTVEFGSVRVAAGGGDIHGLVITTSPPATISGTVIFDGTSKAPKPGRIITTMTDPRMFPRNFDDSGNIDEAGRFQIKSGPGRVLFAATSVGIGMPAQGWSVKSVTHEGVDITDSPLDIPASGEISNIEITITDKVTAVSGTVRNSRGEQVRDYTVVIFPGRPVEAALATRYTRLARPDQQGRFETRGLPPGASNRAGGGSRSPRRNQSLWTCSSSRGSRFPSARSDHAHGMS